MDAQVRSLVTFFIMKNLPSGSIFESVLQKAIQEVPQDSRKDLPLGIVMLETDGTLSSIHVAPDDNDDAVSSMMALEYILYSFDRQDWMAEFLLSMENLREKLKEDTVLQRRASLTLIDGGKLDTEE